MERSGDKKYGYKISWWTIRYVMKTFKIPYTQFQMAMNTDNDI